MQQAQTELLDARFVVTQGIEDDLKRLHVDLACGLEFSCLEVGEALEHKPTRPLVRITDALLDHFDDEGLYQAVQHLLAVHCGFLSLILGQLGLTTLQSLQHLIDFLKLADSDLQHMHGHLCEGESKESQFALCERHNSINKQRQNLGGTAKYKNDTEYLQLVPS